VLHLVFRAKQNFVCFGRPVDESAVLQRANGHENWLVKLVIAFTGDKWCVLLVEAFLRGLL